MIKEQTLINIKAKWLFYITSFFNSFSLGVTGPLLIVYLLLLNINPAQIGLLLAVERIAAIIFDAPTGTFADRYGRKKSLLVCFFLNFLIFIIWFVTKDFYLLLILSMSLGISSTFQSGAEDSLIIDNLKLEANDRKRTKIFSRLAIFGNFGFLVGGLMAMVITNYSIRFIWLVAGLINLFIFSLYGIFIKENFKGDILIKTQNNVKKILKQTKENLAFSLRSKTIAPFFIITIVFGLTIAIYSLSYPIIFKDNFNFPIPYFGLLGSSSAAVGILGAYIGERLTGKNGYYFSIGLSGIALLLLFFIFGLSKNLVFALFIFLMIELAKDSWYPVNQSFFNKFIPSTNRAGILSINSTISSLALAVGEIAAGIALFCLKPNILIMIASLLFIFIPLSLRLIKKASLEQPKN